MAEEERFEPETSESAPAPTRRSRVRKVVVRLLAVLVAVVAALFVTFFTVDLGPALRERAERAGSDFLQRPMRIGRLSATLTPGVFVVEDLVIDGVNPGDRPFLKAKKITVEVPWWTAFNRHLIIQSVDMSDWEMVVETFRGGGHNFPRFTRQPRSGQPGSFRTTVRRVVAARGQFTFDDHGTPWSTVARNLNVQVHRPLVANTYLGTAAFSNGTVRIQSYEPFRTDMRSRFTIDGGKVHFDHMDLLSDGSRSVVTGDVDLGRWPEQLYQVRSQIDFSTQKNIFFNQQNFTVSGKGDFTGTFHLFKGGRELKGTFSSPMAGVNDWRFPDLRGSVLWVPDRLEITNTTTQLYGGSARFDYRMAPFGKGVPTRAVWDVDYNGVDLARLTDFLQLPGLRVSGRASGRNRLEWPLGRWAQKIGGGDVTVTPPAGVRPMTRELAPDLVAALDGRAPDPGPFDPRESLGYLPVAGRVVYGLDPEWIVLDKSWAATERTFVEFEGQTAFGERSRIPFHVTSLDWQESDRVLAGIMTAFGAPTGAIEIGGYGQFDGVMLHSFRRPRIEGTFEGDRMRAWDVVWGRGRAEVVIENAYAFVAGAVITHGDSEVRADGQFSLGYPRKDGGEQINAIVRVNRRPIADLRHAFELDDYPIDGALSGEYHLFGEYETPFGYGRMLIENGVAYRETFDRATASLRFEGPGIRLDRIEIAKSTGSATGAAFVGWDGSYSFNIDGSRIPVESLATASFPRAPLFGVLRFNATGAGTFDSPRYEVKLNVVDLFAGDEGIGQLTGLMSVRDTLLTLGFEIGSPRLSVSGQGRLALTPDMEADLSVRFGDTSLDPYVRFFEPRLSPFTTAVAQGTVRVVGKLANLAEVAVSANVEELNLKLFDYELKNSGPLRFSLDQNVVKIDQFRLAGEGTQLQLAGQVALDERQIAIDASGDANLGILQGFYRDIRARGTAALEAHITGRFDQPVFSGRATLTDGRLRHFSIPHALETVNGTLSFDAAGVRVDDVTARLGTGDVRFGGRIGLNGFALGELALTAVGEQMRVRYPEGFASTIDADLALQGPISAPLLHGTVIVRDSRYARRFETSPDLFNLGGREVVAGVPAPAATLPLRFDIEINAPGTLRIENNVAKVVASADMRLQGTYDRPQLFGHAEIDRGDLIFEGNRYTITRGSFEFFNPTRIEPTIDLEAETRVRIPGQTYNITIGFTGTYRGFDLQLNSDPPLPQPTIVALLLGQTTNLEDAELRALQPDLAQQSEQQLLQSALARIATSPLSAGVSRIFEDVAGIQTAIAPTLGSDTDALTPSARLILGKRISSRAYLTFARALGSTTERDQIVVLEYDQNDRMSWVITQTGERTFAIDFRVRHRF